MDSTTSQQVLATIGLGEDNHVAVQVLKCLLEKGSVKKEVVIEAYKWLGLQVSKERQEQETGRLSLPPGGTGKESQLITRNEIPSVATGGSASADTDAADAKDSMEVEPPAVKDPKEQAQPPKPAHRYRHVALLFHYDGASYSGFAQNLPPASSKSSKFSDRSSSPVPASVTNDNSIERTLFAALTKTCLISSREEANYSRAGRTDRGVSAWGQVVALNLKSAVPIGARLPAEGDNGDGEGEKYGKEVTEDDLPLTSDAADGLDCYAPVRAKKSKKKNKKQKTGDGSTATTATNTPPTVEAPQLKRRTISELNYVRMLNNVLPPTIRVLGWCPVTPEFSARFSCSDRTYRYHFIRRKLDLKAMEQALQKMVGRHDFRNMCKMNVEQVYNFERVIKSAKIVDPASDAGANGATGPSSYYDTCHFEIIGQAFLWHQIRCIVSILFMVGQGLESPDIVDHLLDVQTNPGKPSYPMADELPLVLHRCSYGDTNEGSVDRVPFRRSVRDLWRVACDLENRWEEMTLAAARLRDGLESLKVEAMVSRSDVETFVAEILEERQKKCKRLPSGVGNLVLADGKSDSMIGEHDETSKLSWGDALSEISTRLGVEPTPEGQKEILHIPLLHRSRGTTYEEKVASLKAEKKDNSDDTKKRRRERYEENIVQKRKTTEEDAAFYEHMLSQGGR